MLEMKNGFVVIDNNCMQCRKDLGDRRFLFIQAIAMDGNGICCVVANIEDLKEMSLNDIECAICGYYDNIKTMENLYKLPLGQLDELVAECSFENHPYCDWEHKSETVTLEEAEKIIQHFIDTNGSCFLSFGNDIDVELYKKAMEIGYLFNKKYMNDERTYEWSCSVECSMFCEYIIGVSREINNSIKEAFDMASESYIIGIKNNIFITKDHDWDEYCKGFLAGEILGMPTEENMELVRKAEKLWHDTSYGYYQEVLEEVKCTRE